MIEDYLRTLPEPATWERVRDGFWYIRLPGEARRWIPIELELDEKSVKLTSHYCVEPEENHADAFRFLLQHSMKGSGLAFASDRERVLCIVTRIPLELLSAERLDDVIGRIVDLTETTFRSFLRIGFASRFTG